MENRQKYRKYRQCRHCLYFTDADEKFCPVCGKNFQNPPFFSKRIITLAELIIQIKKGVILPNQIWTKYPRELQESLQDLST